MTAPFTLAQLIDHLPAYQLHGPADTPISGIVFDSRRVRPGDLFVAFKGLSLDGHRYIEQALANGASAIVAEQPPPCPIPSPVPLVRVPDGREALAYLSAAWYEFPGRQMTVVGVTGTDGKTSTINLIYHILKQSGRKVGMISTVNALIDDQALDTGFHVTTPDAPDVQRYMAQMVRAGVQICLLETTSHGLAWHRVTGCDYDLGVVTNITHDHLNHHGSLEAYRLAKARLFDELAGQGAILNTDDWSFDFLRQRIDGRIPITSYGLAENAAVRGTEISLQPDATRFTVTIAGRSYPVESPLVGAFNVSNILAALATTVVGLDVTITAALTALRTFGGVPGRMERIDMGQPFTAIVDFAHAPNALQRALETVRLLTEGRVIAVFGCAGERDVAKRTMMGRIAAELADITIITAEDPRTESLAAIIDATAQAMRAQGAVEYQPDQAAGEFPALYRVPDRGRALYLAAQLARPGDIVIALGKGHEQSMCFGETEYPWDDRAALRQALAGQPLLTLPTAAA